MRRMINRVKVAQVLQANRLQARINRQAAPAARATPVLIRQGSRAVPRHLIRALPDPTRQDNSLGHLRILIRDHPDLTRPGVKAVHRRQTKAPRDLTRRDNNLVHHQIPTKAPLANKIRAVALRAQILVLQTTTLGVKDSRTVEVAHLQDRIPSKAAHRAQTSRAAMARQTRGPAIRALVI